MITTTVITKFKQKLGTEDILERTLNAFAKVDRTIDLVMGKEDEGIDLVLSSFDGELEPRLQRIFDIIDRVFSENSRLLKRLESLRGDCQRVQETLNETTTKSYEQHRATTDSN